jgi:hypothetical protein
MELAVAVRRSVWAGLPEPVRTSLGRAWSMGVPGYASALHARWWQLGTWLRSLAYFRLTFSRRPWSDAYHSGTRISGRPGFLWHAVFNLYGDGFEVANLWNDYEMTRPRVRSSVPIRQGR